ncbi:MAG: 4Fe-4S dicluster domain-containing protein [Gammaproteobacteria bacterium]|nr:4Fe-4S dicluster domain-containing protein [Gammaproteobacteria bacterium]
MRRRDLLKKMIVAASTFGLASVPYAIGRLMVPLTTFDFSNHLRPPGALVNEDDFIRACIGCGLCGEVCPPRCILFEKREGGNGVNTPYIDPELKACILCQKCMDVCPTDAITKIDIHEVNMGLAQIDRTACYPWVDRGICGACVNICPLGEKAIAFEFANMYRPYIKEDGCVGCGICVEVCPHPSLPIRIVESVQGTVTRHNA